jgi:hypothetical protein
MNQVDEIIGFLFESRTYPPELESWLLSSRTFRTFVQTHKEKIRKKVRTADDPARLEDFMCELKVGYAFLQDRRFEVEYEKYSASKNRGADFTVTFRANVIFNLEVTHLRQSMAAPPVERLINVLADKIGQAQPGMMNILLIVSQELISEADLKRAMNRLKQMADQKQEDFFKRRGYRDAADFVQRSRQLSAVGIWRSASHGLVWLNPGAKFPLPKEVAAFIQCCPLL